MEAQGTLTTHQLEPYVPRVLAEWNLDAPGRLWQRVDGTLCFVDISGFTNLSEKLASRGRIGAEELTEVLDRVFGNMLRLAYDRGGSLLKFGGDALLLLFQGDDHEMQGVCAAIEMRAALRDAVKIPTSVGKIKLRMSVGIHTGRVDLFRVGESHHELIITGKTATTTTEMEGTADAGEIVISRRLRDALPAGATLKAKGDGWILRWIKPRAVAGGPISRRRLDDNVYVRCVPVGLRELLSVTDAEPEHRIATVGFVKFKGIEQVWLEDGPEAVAAGLDRLITTVQQAVDPESVTFLATDIDEDGGKVILTTGVPVTQADDEGRMLRVLRRIAESEHDFPLKIGTNRGHVFAGEIGTEFRSTYTVMGDTVNLAARLMAAAPPGEVYAAPGVLDRSLTLFETNVLPPFYVKGKDAPVQAYSVGTETGSRPVEWKRELPFTGRAAELRLLRNAIGAVGGGQSLRVSGETGIGKTRLVLEALADVPRGETFFVRAEPNGVSNTYWAFRDPLRHRLGVERTDQATMAAELASAVASLDDGLMPYLPLIADVAHIDVPETPETAAIEPRFRPDRTAATMVELFGGLSDGRQVIFIDDAHWLDQASAGLVSAFARVAAEHAWLVVTTERRDDAPLDFLADAEIDLGQLDEDAVRQIVISMTEAAPLRPHDFDAIVDRAGGSPLFLAEILRLVRETGSTDALPDSLDAVVGAEIDTLPTLPRRLLLYSSVLGRSFRRVVLDELLKPEEVELDAASRRILARFIEPDGRTRLRFRHSVMHAVAYEGLSYRKRRELHGRAGEVIERLAGRDTDSVAEFLSLHYAEAGEHEKAWRYGVVAGDRAKAAFADVEAGEHYRRALAERRYLSGASSRDAWRVAESLGDVLEQAGMFGEALASFGVALQRADDRVSKALIMMKRARVHVRVGSYPAAVRQTTSGARLVEGMQGPDASFALSQLLALASGVRLQQGRPGMALPLAERARDLALANDDSDALARAYTVLDGALEMLGRPEEAVYADRARAIYEELGDTPGVATVDNNVGVRAYDEGRWDDAVAAYSRAQEEFRLSGNLPQAALCGANIGEVLVSQGHLDEADPILRDAVRDLRSADFADLVIFAEIQLARLDLARARFADVCEALERLQGEANQLGQRDIALEAAIHLADGLISTGSPERALEVLGSAESDAGEEAALYEAGLLRIRARAALELGRKDEAWSRASQGLEVAREQGLVYELALIHRIRGQASASSDQRDLEEADRLLQVLSESSPDRTTEGCASRQSM